MLTFIILAPLIAGLLLCLAPRSRELARAVAILATGVSFLATLFVFWRFDRSRAAEFQFTTRVPWVKSLDLNYFVGVDGINLVLVLLAALVCFAAVLVSWNIEERAKEFYILLLFMSSGVLGAFASLDIFFFYFFHELALIPTFLMVGIWGGRERRFAAMNLTLYLTAGALLSLLGLIAIYVLAPEGQQTFDITKLVVNYKASAEMQRWIFPMLLFGFGTLVSLFPLHTWAPIGYSQAPAATAMIHAGVLKKFGLYGLLRIAIPLMPEGAQLWMEVLVWLCAANLVYCGYVALSQRNLNDMLGYASVSHVGYIFLGLASLNVLGVTGAVLLMFAHGVLAALGFAISNHIQTQTNTRDMDELGGLAQKLPFIGTCFALFALAGCGLPGFANFASEIMIFFGAWKQWWPFVIAGAWTVVISAVYFIRATRSIFYGDLREEHREVKDPVSLTQRLPYVLLLTALLTVGFYPRALTDLIRPGVARIVEKASTSSRPSPGNEKQESPAVPSEKEQSELTLSSVR